MTTKLDHARRAEVRRLAALGVSHAELGRRFGVHNSTISKMLGGLPTRRSRASRAEIRRLWSEGCPGVEIARRFGLAKSTVSGIVADLPKRRRYGDPWEVAWPLPRREVDAPAKPPAPYHPPAMPAACKAILDNAG